METNKHPEISINTIDLIDCHVGNINQNHELVYNLGISKIDRIKIDEEELRVLVTFDLMKGVEKPPFTLTCSFLSIYSREKNSNMKWDEFTDGNAIYHMIPYFREFASAITLRLPVPPLIIPPINVNLILEEYEQVK